MGQDEQSNSPGELLRRLGIRQTPQRLLIVSVLQGEASRLSIEDILARVRDHAPGVSVSTVYRTLTRLERAGVVTRVTLPGEGITYQAISDVRSAHLLVCQECRRVIPFEYDLTDLSSFLQRAHDFHVVRPAVVATGYCDLCWQRVGEPR